MQKHQYNKGGKQRPGCAHVKSSSFETHAVAFRGDLDTNKYSRQREAHLDAQAACASINGIRVDGKHAPGVSNGVMALRITRRVVESGLEIRADNLIHGYLE